ncbi:hypothetical protein THAOC_06905, partial [Thalassiosira oceanica]
MSASNFQLAARLCILHLRVCETQRATPRRPASRAAAARLKRFCRYYFGVKGLRTTDDEKDGVRSADQATEAAARGRRRAADAAAAADADDSATGARARNVGQRDGLSAVRLGPEQRGRVEEDAGRCDAAGIHASHRQGSSASLQVRRYRDVVDVYIYSLLGTVDVSSPLLANTVDSDTIERAVPFLSNFPKLERVFFGGFESIKGLCVGFLRNAYPEAEVEKVRFLINSLCGAFRSGSLSDKLSVLGLVAVGRGGEEMCQTSVNVVKSFPLATVVGCGHTFSTDCSEELTLRSINYHFADHRLYYLEVDMDMTDRRRFIMERPGGKNFWQ